MTIQNQIICGESNAILRDFPSNSVDLVVTDPPYLVGYKDRNGRTVENDTSPDAVLPVYKELYRVLKRDSLCITFYGWHHIDQFAVAWREAGFKPVGQIVWAKPYASRSRYTAYHHESAYVLAKGRPPCPRTPLRDVQEWVYSGNRRHPTEKAVDILTPLIKAYSRQGDLVLDPFAGSGSTAVAASLLGRRYVGIELEKAYCALARQRLAGVSRWEERAAA